jgi:heat shock protein HslJ
VKPIAHLLSPMLLASILLSGPLTAGQIYKWVDENGQTHFGTQPPAESKKKVVGESATQPIANSKGPTTITTPSETLFVGHWKGTRNGNEIDIVFDKNGTFIESFLHKRTGYSDINRRSYGGYWSIHNRHISFKVTYNDQGAEFIPPMTGASFIRYESGKLTLVWDNEPEVLTRQHNQSMPAFPSELRN